MPFIALLRRNCYTLGMTTDHIATEIGARMKAARLLKNLTQAQLAERVSVAERVIKRLEAGQNVHLSTFLAVSTALGYESDLISIFKRDKPTTIEQHQALAHGTYQRRERAR